MSPKLKRWQEEALTTALLRDPQVMRELARKEVLRQLELVAGVGLRRPCAEMGRYSGKPWWISGQFKFKSEPRSDPFGILATAHLAV